MMAETQYEYDAIGHGFLRQYFEKDLAKDEGNDKEYPVSQNAKLPKQIVFAIKRGDFDHRVFYKQAGTQFESILTPMARKAFEAEESKILDAAVGIYPELARYNSKGNIVNKPSVKLVDKLATLLMDYVRRRKNRKPAWK